MVLSAFLEHKHFGGKKYIPQTNAPSVAPRHVEMKYTEPGPYFVACGMWEKAQCIIYSNPASHNG